MERHPQGKKEKNFDLKERLINFGIRIIKLTEQLPDSKTGNHIRGQIVRSGTSPASNYAEAQVAESRSDFIHKLKLALKELRETKVWLKIIVAAQLIDERKLGPLLSENDELISILFTSIETAKKNKESGSKKNKR